MLEVGDGKWWERFRFARRSLLDGRRRIRDRTSGGTGIGSHSGRNSDRNRPRGCRISAVSYCASGRWLGHNVHRVVPSCLRWVVRVHAPCCGVSSVVGEKTDSREEHVRVDKESDCSLRQPHNLRCLVRPHGERLALNLEGQGAAGCAPRQSLSLRRWTTTPEAANEAPMKNSARPTSKWSKAQATAEMPEVKTPRWSRCCPAVRGRNPFSSWAR